ncbi:MAG: hypothetical protein CMF44_02700 [Legionellales bacterium]|mgnify:FL=1|jgi:hypothetical protein|nr:hypothetical protein [Legionellales bacterium]|tara:strand:+ start:536 stop:721 length:186 start_codon:yes stop_codon:yes gene_type:complete
MNLWEQILLGMVAVIVTFLFWPGIKKAIEQSKNVENPDWAGALIPIGVVVLFIIFLISVSG